MFSAISRGLLSRLFVLSAIAQTTVSAPNDRFFPYIASAEQGPFKTSNGWTAAEAVAGNSAASFLYHALEKAEGEAQRYRDLVLTTEVYILDPANNTFQADAYAVYDLATRKVFAQRAYVEKYYQFAIFLGHELSHKYRYENLAKGTDMSTWRPTEEVRAGESDCETIKGMSRLLDTFNPDTPEARRGLLQAKRELDFHLTWAELRRAQAQLEADLLVDVMSNANFLLAGWHGTGLQRKACVEIVRTILGCWNGTVFADQCVTEEVAESVLHRWQTVITAVDVVVPDDRKKFGDKADTSLALVREIRRLRESHDRKYRDLGEVNREGKE